MVDQRAFIKPAMILHPCAVCGVSVKVASTHFVMLTADHATQAAEKALSLIGAHAIVHERKAVVDPLGRIPAVQAVPRCRLVSDNDGTGLNALTDRRDCLIL